MDIKTSKEQNIYKFVKNAQVPFPEVLFWSVCDAARLLLKF